MRLTAGDTSLANSLVQSVTADKGKSRTKSSRVTLPFRRNESNVRSWVLLPRAYSLWRNTKFRRGETCHNASGIHSSEVRRTIDCSERTTRVDAKMEDTDAQGTAVASAQPPPSCVCWCFANGQYKAPRRHSIRRITQAAITSHYYWPFCPTVVQYGGLVLLRSVNVSLILCWIWNLDLI